MAKIPSDDILESLCKFRIRESHQLKTVLELYDIEIYKSETSIAKFDVRHEKIDRCSD